MALGKGTSSGFGAALGLGGTIPEVEGATTGALGLGFSGVRPRGMVLKNTVLGFGVALGWGIALDKGASSGFGIALGLRGTMSEVEGTTVWDFIVASSLRFSALLLFFFDALVSGVSGTDAGVGSEAELIFDDTFMCLATALRLEDSVRSTCNA